jgi:hypothetical protein
MEANAEWELSHPEEASKLRKPVDAEAAAEPVAEPAKVEEQKTEPEKVVATPAAIDSWLSDTPELKAVFDQHPEKLSQIMEMARSVEAAKPILDIVGTKEEAEFAVDHANRLVSLQSNWMLAAEDPEMATAAWDQTVEMFKERDAEGKEVLENGKPKLAADFKPFVTAAANAAIGPLVEAAKSRMDALKAKLAGSYPNDEARQVDEDALEQADYAMKGFQFVLAELSHTDDGPQLPVLPPDATEQQKAFQKHLEEEQKKVDANKGKQSTAERKAAQAKLDREVDGEWSNSIRNYIETNIQAMEDRGEYIPRIVIEDKWINPNTGQAGKNTAFGMKLYLQLNDKIYGNPVHRAKLANLQAQRANGKAARIAELTRLQSLYLPALFNAEVKRIQDSVRGSGKKKPAPTTARVEPTTSATVVPSAMDDKQVRAWAEGEAKKDPSFASMSVSQREETILDFMLRRQFKG